MVGLPNVNGILADFDKLCSEILPPDSVSGRRVKLYFNCVNSVKRFFNNVASQNPRSTIYTPINVSWVNFRKLSNTVPHRTVSD